jgi:hypothetical protein
MSAHEPQHNEIQVKGSSDRAFGLVFTVVFAVIAVFPLLKGGSPAWWALLVSGAFLLPSVIRPSLLRPLNRLWTRFGLLLHKVTNPVIMLFLYIVAIIPVGLILRAVGKDVLNIKRDSEAKSYWIERDPPGPDPSTMPNQF